MFNTKGWQAALEIGTFAVSPDLAADFLDDPTIQVARYVSLDLSPSNSAGSTERFLGVRYIGWVFTTDARERAQIRDGAGLSLQERGMTALRSATAAPGPL